VEDGDEKATPYHIVLLAKNSVGLRNLYEIVTEAHLSTSTGRRGSAGLLQAKREGILVGSACEAGEVFKSILTGKSIEDKGGSPRCTIS
jgi:DNA polymerase-3 subunit alpha (Gram-positive type)